MADHTLRLLDSIEGACQQHLDEGISVEGLQATVEPIVAALEVPHGGELEAALRHFVAQLEYIRFMVDEPEQDEEVEEEIERLRSRIASYKNCSATDLKSE